MLVINAFHISFPIVTATFSISLRNNCGDSFALLVSSLPEVQSVPGVPSCQVNPWTSRFVWPFIGPQPMKDKRRRELANPRAAIEPAKRYLCGELYHFSRLRRSDGNRS